MIRLLVSINQPVGRNAEAIGVLVQKVLEDTTGEQNVIVEVMPTEEYWKQELERCKTDPVYFFERYWKNQERMEDDTIVKATELPALSKVTKPDKFEYMVWDGELETANVFLGKYNEAWRFDTGHAEPYRIWVAAAKSHAGYGQLIARHGDEVVVEEIKQPVKWPGRREASEHLMKALGTEGVHWQYADFPGVKLKLLETNQIVNRGEIICIGEYGHLWKALPDLNNEYFSS